jgi:hypothetical protein
VDLGVKVIRKLLPGRKAKHGLGVRWCARSLVLPRVTTWYRIIAAEPYAEL